MRRIVMVLFAALAIGLTGCSDQDGLAIAPTPSNERADAPTFALPDLRSERELSLSRYRGRPLLLNFWASFCGPCIEEMPAIAEFARKHPDIAVLGIASLERAEDSLSFLEGRDIGFDLATDVSGETLREYGGIGLPTTVLVDVDGRIISMVSGPIDADLNRLGETLRAG